MNYTLKINGNTPPELACGIAGLASSIIRHEEVYGKSPFAKEVGTVSVNENFILFETEDIKSLSLEIIEFINSQIKDNKTQYGILEYEFLNLCGASFSSRFNLFRALQKCLYTHPRHHYKVAGSPLFVNVDEDEDPALQKLAKTGIKPIESLAAKEKTIQRFLDWIDYETELEEHRSSNNKKKFKSKKHSGLEKIGQTSEFFPNCQQLYSPIKGDSKNLFGLDAFEMLAMLFFPLGAYPMRILPNDSSLTIVPIFDLIENYEKRKIGASLGSGFTLEHVSLSAEESYLQIASLYYDPDNNSEFVPPVSSYLYVSAGNKSARKVSVRNLSLSDQDIETYRQIKTLDLPNEVVYYAVEDIVKGRPIYFSIGKNLVSQSKLRKAKSSDDRGLSVENRKSLFYFSEASNGGKGMNQVEENVMRYVKSAIKRTWAIEMEKPGASKIHANKGKDRLFRSISKAQTKNSFLDAFSSLSGGSPVSGKFSSKEISEIWDFISNDWERAKNLVKFSFTVIEESDPKVDVDEETETEEDHSEEISNY